MSSPGPRAAALTPSVVLACLVIAALAVLQSWAPITDEDAPWHLLHARFVLETGSTTYPDFVSFTRPGVTYVNQPWLPELLMLGLYEALGWMGLSIYTAVFAALAAIACCAVALRAAGDRPWWGVAVAAIAVGVITWRFSPRPLMLSLVFLPGSLVLAETFAHETRRARVITSAVGLVALFTVWSICHGSYVLLPAITGVALAGALQVHGRRHVVRRAGLLVVLGALTLATPGAWTHFALIENVALGDATKYIAEMRPLTWEQLVPAHLNSILFLDLLVVLAVVKIVRARHVRLDDLGLAVLGMALALTAHRFRDAWGIMMIPLVARSATDAASAASARWDRRWATLLVAAVPAVLWVGSQARDPGRTLAGGLDRDAHPVDLADFLERNRVEGALLNRYDDGGYLSFRLYPHVKIAIDGRTPTLFDDELFFLVRQTVRNPRAFEELDRRYAPDMAAVLGDMPLCRYLARHTGWRAAYVDRTQTLFLRDTFRPELGRIEALDPCAPFADLAEASFSRERCGPVHRDLVRLMEHTPDAPFPLVLAARHDLACSGRADRALGLVEEALVATESAEHYLAGVPAALRAGRLELAERWAERALTLDRESLRARREQLSVLVASGRDEATLALLDQLASEHLDGLPPDLRMTLAEALDRAGRADEAALQARRVLWVTGSTTARQLVEQNAPELLR